MGCAQSRIDNEESVARCKDRKTLMKDAVVARNAFAAGHSGYAISLKNTGAALSDYGHGEAEEPPEDHHQIPPLDSTPQPPPPPPMMDNLPPPPPLPNFSPSPVAPIKRAVSMPAMPVKSREKFDSSLAIEEEDEEEDEEEEEEQDHHEENEVRENSNNENLRKDSRGPHREEITPPRTPENNNVGHHLPPMPEAKNIAWDYFFLVDDNMPGPSLQLDDNNNEADNRNVDTLEKNVGGVGFVGHNGVDCEIEPKTPQRPEEKMVMSVEVDDKGKQQVQIEHSKTAPADFRRVVKAVSSVNLMQLLNDIDDHFLKASECAQEVSNMLEATRLHYHSNFADNRGHIDHSARVMRVITWNRSFRGMTNGENGKDEFDSEENETHATVLDKLLAWEKKLYDEVKQGELMKLEYKRKVAWLNKQKKRGASAESLEKTKAAVSHLHTRYIVDMQSMDSTVSEVNRLRDEQLYPKLVMLVDGMAKMWASMCIHHDSQLKIVEKLKSLDSAYASKETTKHHHERTIQLHNVVQEWHSQFDKLVTHQKQYIQALNNWLKLNLIPIESSLKEKISSPPREQNPPIQALLHAWHDYLERLPDEVAKSAIFSFAAVIKTIIVHQDEEMKLKEKCEETRKEFLRKNQAFEEWYHKYKQRRSASDEIDAERGEDANTKDPVSERQLAVESLKKRLEEEVEAHKKHCIQVREKSLGSLKSRLPELFRAMSDYSHACSDAYEKLRTVTQSQKPNNAPL
ncbi:nitrate regulatory gene2 protein-like [Durio zibethinus]|uniref:Nitrate regulatory gene2 protein-like n=1 Tax=Durio zibethinus TaxID=66656 RepID=A0A6P5XR75_DURZI|nr:nitrate regulatory gene2 protein-like [Durio zibethinus]